MTDTTRLIVDADDPETLTKRRATDVRTALGRGLQEYLKSLGSFIAEGGRRTAIDAVTLHWAQPEAVAKFPSIAIVGDDPMAYGDDVDGPLTPRVLSDTRFDDGSYLVQHCEGEQLFMVQLWATDPPERMALAALVEEAFAPVEWMYGFRLELPHYHGAHAEFTPLALTYQDSEEQAQRRYRLAIIALRARVAKYTLTRPLPLARPRFGLTVDGEDA
jgi:hypothetical protein